MNDKQKTRLHAKKTWSESHVPITSCATIMWHFYENGQHAICRTKFEPASFQISLVNLGLNCLLLRFLWRKILHPKEEKKSTKHRKILHPMFNNNIKHTIDEGEKKTRIHQPRVHAHLLGYAWFLKYTMIPRHLSKLPLRHSKREGKSTMINMQKY